jgi:hypothetical protein
MFYGDCEKMCEDFVRNFGEKRTGFCIKATHRLTIPFSPGYFFYQKEHEWCPPFILLFSVSLIEDKTELPPF